MPIRVLLVDDHPNLRAAVRAVLSENADIEVIAEAGDGQSAVRLAAELAPDVVVMDVRLPDMSGLEATVRIMAERAGTRVVVMSAYVDEQITAAAAASGAFCVVRKENVFDELATAVRRAATGATVGAGPRGPAAQGGQELGRIERPEKAQPASARKV